MYFLHLKRDTHCRERFLPFAHRVPLTMSSDNFLGISIRTASEIGPFPLLLLILSCITSLPLHKIMTVPLYSSFPVSTLAYHMNPCTTSGGVWTKQWYC